MMEDPTSHTAKSLHAFVEEDECLETLNPLLPDTPDTFDDLIHAAEATLAFWDNPHDDEDWQEG
jgi:hypothetical protein